MSAPSPCAGTNADDHQGREQRDHRDARGRPAGTASASGPHRGQPPRQQPVQHPARSGRTGYRGQGEVEVGQPAGRGVVGVEHPLTSPWMSSEPVRSSPRARTAISPTWTKSSSSRPAAVRRPRAATTHVAPAADGALDQVVLDALHQATVTTRPQPDVRATARVRAAPATRTTAATPCDRSPRSGPARRPLVA